MVVCVWRGGGGCGSVLVVSDAHVFSLFLFSWFCLLFVLSCLVNNGLPWVWCVGLRVCGVFWLLVVCGFVFGCGVRRLVLL